jgi:hypothetical protein
MFQKHMRSLEGSRLVGVAVFLAVSQARAQSPEQPQASTASSDVTSSSDTAPAPSPGVAAPVPVVPPDAPLLDNLARSLSFYGFVELDVMHDTTQSYGPASNNAMLARPGSYAGAHARSQITAQNSQLGLRFTGPDDGGVRTSAQAEIDFFGVQPTDATEQTAFTTPQVRMRLFYGKIETPFVDLLAGQYHELFGWGGEGFYVNSVAFLGVAGEIYHRNPQIRLSKSFGGSALKLDLAIAAVRPIQRDSEVPDVQGGIKLAVNGWKGATAQGFGRPVVLPLSIGVSGVGRRFAVAEFLTSPGDAKVAYGWGIAANAFLPLIPARRGDGDRSNALSLTGELSIGSGISDLYTGLTAGALFPLLPDPSGNLVPPPVYRPNIDSGIVTYDANGNLKTINWRALVLGLQYYLPIRGGRAWIAATASRLESTNILSLTPEASRGGIFTRQDYIDGNLFAAVTPAVQIGVSYQITQQTFGDRPFADTAPHPVTRNHRTEIGFRLFF